MAVVTEKIQALMWIQQQFEAIVALQMTKKEQKNRNKYLSFF